MVEIAHLKKMYEPSFARYNLMHRNVLKKYLFETVDHYSRNYLLTKYLFKEPAIGYFIIQDQLRSDEEKLNYVLDFLMNPAKSVVTLVVGDVGQGKTAMVHYLFEKMYERGCERPLVSVRNDVPEEYPDWLRVVKQPQDAPENSIIMWDEAAIWVSCLEKNTKIITETGPKRIIDCKTGEKVMSYSFEKNKVEKKPIISKSIEKSEIIKIVLENGKRVECSPNHRWFVKDGNKIVVKMAKDLTNESLITKDLENVGILNIEKTKEKKDVVDIEVKDNHNFILANGLLSHNSRRSMSAENIQLAFDLATRRHKGYSIIFITQHCLEKNTRIITENGVKEIKDCKTGEKVLSYNVKKKKTEYKRITSKATRKEKTLRIVLENGEVIECTPEHRLYTDKGIIPAKLLSIHHKIFKVRY